MKSVLLIGMGQFGQLLGEKLINMGDEVMIVDKDEDVINVLAPKYTGAIIANCMNADNIRSLDVPSYDVCVVTIADDFQSSLEITSVLKDLGAKYVVSKANTDVQRKFLFRVGADEVIYPNRDMAEKLAVKINSQKVYDYIELDSEFSIFEIAVPTKWIGKTIMDANPRAKYELNILTIKKGNKIMPTPTPNTIFEEGDKMVVFGNTEKIIAFTNTKK
ncbi:MAG: TrkA family potassium uptake protein [Clostridia bacterium]|jgi:trk system potassium uptake protein TrkA|nr:TrkA family potassium uptake protein [Clostridia bacterium]